jgi:serine protease AprX
VHADVTVSSRSRREGWGAGRGAATVRKAGSPSTTAGAFVVLAVILSTALLAALGGAGPSGAVASSPLAEGSVNPALAQLAQQRPAERVEVIVQLDPRVSFAQAAGKVRSLGGTPGREVRVIHAISADLTAAAALRLSGLPGIRHVSENGAIATRAARPEKLETAYNDSIAAIDAWLDRDLTGRGVGVAVVDTGIAGGLPDFRVSKQNKLSRVRVAAAVHPEATDAADHYGHGTHVAGLIAGNSRARDAKDPLRGRYMGVAPGARLISIKASDDHGAATVLDVIYGIQFAIDHRERYDIRILNLSLSSTVADSYLNDPLNAAAESAWLKGLLVVAAAGNEGAAPDATSYAPGNDPYVLTVGAVDDQGTPKMSDDELAPWSSRGLTRDGIAKPEVLAPGAHMVSLNAPGSDFADMCPECVVDGEYFQAGGTSMAAAIASGAAALILESRPHWTNDQVKTALIERARNVPGVGEEIDVEAALKAKPDKLAKQKHKVTDMVHPLTGDIDYEVAKWRVAKWRALDLADAGWAGASWRCDCSTDPQSGQIDPSVAKWRGASWRTSFTK